MCYLFILYLVYFLGQSLDTIYVQATVLHGGSQVPSIRANGDCAQALLIAANFKEQLTCLYVDKSHDVILTQHSKNLEHKCQS